MKALSFGEILFDQINNEDYIGGAPFNFAVHLARSGQQSYMLSALGKDSLGEKALAEVRKNGIKEDYISRNDRDTGLVEVTLSNGIPSYSILENRAWDTLEPPQGLLQEIIKQNWDLVYIGSLAQRSSQNYDFLHKSLLPRLKSKELFFDVNLRQNYYNRDIIKKSLRYTTILKVNDEELPIITKLAGFFEKDTVPQTDALFERYPRIHLIILTLGSEGAQIFQRDSSFKVPANPDVQAVDTVGAGDSFSSAFCLTWHYTGQVKLAAETASQLADYVVTQRGALPEYSTRIKDILAAVQKK